MKIAATLIVAALLAAPVSAQPIHGHPQKAFYASSSEYPVRDWQCHGRPGNSNAEPTPPFPVIPVGVSMLDPQIAHAAHLACAFPDYAEIGAAFSVSCTIKTFHTAGVVSGVYSPLEQIRDVVYEDTGSSTPPVMRGDPMGLRQWNVRFIFDPTLIRHTFPPATTTPHGWFGAQMSVRTTFDNSRSISLDHVRPFYSVLDPSKPESPMSDEGLPNGARCSPNDTSRPELSPNGNQMGTVVSEFVGLLPIAPIPSDSKWYTFGFFYGYAALEGYTGPFRFPNGTFELRKDIDLHNGNVGVLLMTETFDGLSPAIKKTPITIDPAQLGSGTHKLAAIWQQPDGKGNDYTALATFDVTVGPGVPVQTLCTDDKATNKGQPLPCVFPPQVLPNTWDVFTPIFRVNSLDPTKMQVCRTADLATCKELVK